MTTRGWRKWWRRSVVPVIRGHQTVVAAASPLLGALVGVVTNLITGEWRWWLFLALVVLVALATWQVILLASGATPQKPVIVPGLLSTGLRRFSGRLFGRDEDVKRLSRTIKEKGGRRIHVLHGIAGNGKSALASVIGEQAKDVHRMAVRWVDASQPDLLFGGLREVSASFPRPFGGENVQNDDPTNLLWDRLEAVALKKRWLLILDGLDDIHLVGERSVRMSLHGWLRKPPPNCTIVITTTDGRKDNFPDSEVVLHRVGGLSRLAGGQMLTSLAPDAGPAVDAELLSNELHGHPMALKLVGHYLKLQDVDGPRSFRDYHNTIRRDLRWDRLFRRRSEASTLAAVLRRTLRVVDAQYPGSVLFLGLLSCMSTQPIPRVLLDWTKRCCWTVIGRSIFGPRFSHPETLMRVSDYGLVELAGVGADQIVALHPLIKSLIRDHRSVRFHALDLQLLSDCLTHSVNAGPRETEVRRALTFVVPPEDLPKPPWWAPRVISEQAQACLDSGDHPQQPTQPPVMPEPDDTRPLAIEESRSRHLPQREAG